MARSNVVYSKLRPLGPHVSRCPDCNGTDIGPFTRICFTCHDRELVAAGVDLTPIREGRSTTAAMQMVNRNIRVNPSRAA